MFAGPLRFLSIAASLVVILSCSAFAVDETRSGSEQSQAGIANQTVRARENPAGFANPTPAQEKAREAEHGSVRELLDDADDILLAPFASIADGSSSAWTRRGVPGLLALIVYGFGLGFLARFPAGRA